MSVRIDDCRFEESISSRPLVVLRPTMHSLSIDLQMLLNSCPNLNFEQKSYLESRFWEMVSPSVSKSLTNSERKRQSPWIPDCPAMRFVFLHKYLYFLLV